MSQDEFNTLKTLVLADDQIPYFKDNDVKKLQTIDFHSLIKRDSTTIRASDLLQLQPRLQDEKQTNNTEDGTHKQESVQLSKGQYSVNPLAAHKSSVFQNQFELRDSISKNELKDYSLNPLVTIKTRAEDVIPIKLTLNYK